MLNTNFTKNCEFSGCLRELLSQSSEFENKAFTHFFDQICHGQFRGLVSAKKTLYAVFLHHT